MNVRRDVSYYDCVYCGLRAGTRDHVVPFSYDNFEGRSRIDDDYSTKEVVPACKECNALLHNLWLPSIAERAAYLKTTLESRHSKILRAPDWTEEELEEVTGNLKRQIVSLQRKKKILQGRINILSGVMEMTNLTPLEVWGVLEPEGQNKSTIHSGQGIT